MWPTADLARVQGWTAEPLRGRVSRSVAKIRHLPDTAPADLGRVWYMTANSRPAEPGPFVVQTGLTGTGRWVPGGPRRHGETRRRRTASTNRHEGSPGGDDGQFVLQHLPGRTQQDPSRDPGDGGPARRAGRRARSARLGAGRSGSRNNPLAAGAAPGRVLGCGVMAGAPLALVPRPAENGEQERSPDTLGLSL